MKKLPELLSPAGSPEALEAAVYGGCDAVYLGGKAFNARMNAQNFDSEQMKNAVDFCHKNGVRLYVTLNTLVYDRMFKEALSYAKELYMSGVDALIITDIGLATQIRKQIPDFELHASTQMSCHNSEAAGYLHKLGFTRMVCAREMSKENIGLLIKNSPIEIEMFIHGAMCVCQSGQCLMSSFIGNRSGNRGECAQPCRLPYNGSYPLSLRDMCLAGHVEELIESGVASLKIEGRMKSPDYVYSVTSVYRNLLDEHRNAGKKEIDKMAAVFSRSGFSDGYYTSRIDSSMLGTRSDADKNATRYSGVSIRKKERNLKEIVLQERKEPIIELSNQSVEKMTEKKNTARFYKPETIPDTDFFDEIYLPLDRFQKGKANGIIMPPVINDLDFPKIEKQLENAFKNGAKHCIVGNIGHISLAKKYGFIIHGDYRLNIYNGFSAGYFEDFEDVMLSCELSLAQIRDIKCNKSVIVYGKIPVMTLEKSVETKKLRDRKNVTFNVIREGGRDIVLNSVPFYMADRQQELIKSGIFNRHFVFTTENQAEVLSVINAYKNKKAVSNNIKRIK